MELTRKRILELMAEQKVSRKKLACELNVSYSALNNYLNGRRWLKLERLRAISSCLHTSSDYLLGLSDQMHPDQHPGDEQALLDYYRQLPPHAKRFILQQTKQMEQLCRQFDRLK